MDKQTDHLPVALGFSLVIHAAVLSAGPLSLRYPPQVIEQTGINVELYSPASLPNKISVPNKTHSARRAASAPPAIRAPAAVPAQAEDSVAAPAPLVTAETPQSSVARESAIYALNRLTRAPRFRHRVDVAYPAHERASGAEAQVLAEAVIDTSGRVTDVAVIKSAGPGFDAAVTAALLESTFFPGYVNSLPVATRVQIPFHFQLN